MGHEIRKDAELFADANRIDNDFGQLCIMAWVKLFE